MKPLIVLLAHPDDELGVFPWLRTAVRDRRDVHCLWLTDGGWGGQDPGRRRRESIAVLEALGMKASQMHFLGEEHGIGDGSLHTAMPRALAIAAPYVPSHAEVLVPAWEGGHPDHDATHLIGLALAQQTRSVARQYPLYNGVGLRGPWFRVLAPLRDNGPVMVAPTRLLERLGYAIRCCSYRSQWKSFVGLLPFYTLRMLRSDAFCLQDASAARTAERPHPGALLYERRGGPSWNEFSGATRDYRAQAPRAGGTTGRPNPAR